MNGSGSSAAVVSYLFVPASRPDRIDKARRSATEEVIVVIATALAIRCKRFPRLTGPQ